ncbi:hypothetical protein OENI_60018 [Oenococcus oeni]|nr:hypothetical protein OENI_60018 [Oenococcus oeni]
MGVILVIDYYDAYPKHWALAKFGFYVNRSFILLKWIWSMPKNRSNCYRLRKIR